MTSAIRTAGVAGFLLVSAACVPGAPPPDTAHTLPADAAAADAQGAADLPAEVLAEVQAPPVPSEPSAPPPVPTAEPAPPPPVPPAAAAPEPGPVAGNGVPPPRWSDRPDTPPQRTATPTPDLGAPVGKPRALTLRAFLDQVLTNNDKINFQQVDQEIAEAAVAGAESIYEPVLTLKAARKRIVQKNTAEESLSRSGLPIFDRRTWEYESGVTMRLPTGAAVEASLTMSKIDSNLQTGAVRGNEHKAFYGVSITQPLARDAGIDATEANINMARVSAAVAGHTSREAAMAIRSQAMAAYYDLRLNQERQQIWDDAIKLAEKLLAEVTKLHRGGQLPKAAVLEVENGIARYQAQASDARQKLVEAMNRARALLVSSANQTPGPLVAADPLPRITRPTLSIEASLARAFEGRPDYLARKKVVEREGIRIAYAENQALPRIDLVASYGLNGLALKGEDAVLDFGTNRNFPTWTAGVEVSMPLYGNEKSESDLRIARLRKKQALIDLQAIEATLANDVETSVNAILNAYDQWSKYQRIVATQQELLETEREMMAAGVSDVRNVLAREEAAINARTGMLEQAVAFEKAKISLQLAEGSLVE